MTPRSKRKAASTRQEILRRSRSSSCGPFGCLVDCCASSGGVMRRCSVATRVPSTAVVMVLALSIVSCGPAGQTEGPWQSGMPQPLTIKTLSLPTAHAGSPYSAQLTASGGAKPYSWAVVGGDLPAGLVLNQQTGAITGMPAKLGTMTITVRVADSSLLQQQKSLAVLDVSVENLVLTILTESLPGGSPGVPYRARLAAAGGTPPYTWSVEEGSLPPDLSLDPFTGEIAGTPTLEGTSTFTIKVTDSSSPAASVAMRMQGIPSSVAR